MREVEAPPRRCAQARWRMEEWAAEHGDDVLTAIVACTVASALAAYMAAY